MDIQTQFSLLNELSKDFDNLEIAYEKKHFNRQCFIE